MPGFGSTGVGACAGVGYIEMGPCEQVVCPTYGWTVSGNTVTSFSDTGFGPGDYSPAGATSQTLSSESVYPPGTISCPDFCRFTLVLGASAGSLWDELLSSYSPVGPSVAVCTSQVGLSHTWYAGSVRVSYTVLRTIEAQNAFCQSTLPYDISDQVTVSVEYADNQCINLVSVINTGTAPNHNAAIVADIGSKADLNSVNGTEIWYEVQFFPPSTVVRNYSHPPDNQFCNVLGNTIAFGGNTLSSTSLGDLYGSYTVTCPGPLQ